MPLEYRWKHMEQALAAQFPGNQQHELAPRTFKLMYKKADVERAENEITRAALAGREVDVKAKQLVRGGKVVKFILSDMGGRKVEKALVMNAPLQHYLNITFAAEAATHTYVQMAMALIPGVSKPTDEMRRARAEAIRLNSRILSGDAGQQAVRDFFELLED